MRVLNVGYGFFVTVTVFVSVLCRESLALQTAEFTRIQRPKAVFNETW